MQETSRVQFLILEQVILKPSLLAYVHCMLFARPQAAADS